MIGTLGIDKQVTASDGRYAVFAGFGTIGALGMEKQVFAPAKPAYTPSMALKKKIR